MSSFNDTWDPARCHDVCHNIESLDRSRDIDNFWVRDTGGRGSSVSVSAPAYPIVVALPARAAPLTVFGMFVQVTSVPDPWAASVTPSTDVSYDRLFTPNKAGACTPPPIWARWYIPLVSACSVLW